MDVGGYLLLTDTQQIVRPSFFNDRNKLLTSPLEYYQQKLKRRSFLFVDEYDDYYEKRLGIVLGHWPYDAICHKTCYEPVTETSLLDAKSGQLYILHSHDRNPYALKIPKGKYKAKIFRLCDIKMQQIIYLRSLGIDTDAPRSGFFNRHIGCVPLIIGVFLLWHFKNIEFALVVFIILCILRFLIFEDDEIEDSDFNKQYAYHVISLQKINDYENE